MKILSIGNSFSTDATTFLHQIALSAGVDITTVNLFIGGCSLETHWNNAQSDAQAYAYELNGTFDGRMASIKEALCEHDWDVVTLHQASLLSGVPDSYHPYFENMLGYVRKYAPRAKIYIMQTWAFDDDCTREGYEEYHNSQKEMYTRLVPCYDEIALSSGLPLVRCGDAVQKLRTLPEFDRNNGGRSICRDGYHMHLIYGRYLLAAIWFKTIFGGNLSRCSFYPEVEGEETDKSLIDLIKNFVVDL